MSFASTSSIKLSVGAGLASLSTDEYKFEFSGEASSPHRVHDRSEHSARTRTISGGEPSYAESFSRHLLVEIAQIILPTLG